MEVGLLFPGQGSQYVGMGRDLYDSYQVARELYHEADSLLGFALSELAFEGPEEALRETRNTQPAVFVHSIAAFRVLSGQGLEPAIAAGHSLGEYSALTAAGAFSFRDALYVVRKRGEFMHEAGASRPGAMAAILGLPFADVQAICKEASQVGVVQPANLNSPTQIAISGEAAAVDAGMRLAGERGAKKVVRLPVGGAFHSSLMEPASRKLSEILESVEISTAAFPVVANYSASLMREPDEIRTNLAAQVLGAVRWHESMLVMLSEGVKHFVEVGPGSVLKGLMRSIDREAAVVSASTPQDILSAASIMEE